MNIKKNELIILAILVSGCLVMFAILIWLNRGDASRVAPVETPQRERPLVEIRGGDGSDSQDQDQAQDQGAGPEADPLEELKDQPVKVTGLLRSSHMTETGTLVLFVELTPLLMARCEFPPAQIPDRSGLESEQEVSLTCVYKGKDQVLRFSGCSLP